VSKVLARFRRPYAWPDPQFGKLGFSMGGRLAELRRSGRGAWLTGSLVPAIPRASPHDLARVWHGRGRPLCASTVSHGLLVGGSSS
jgi:hypothetical protein